MSERDDPDELADEWEAKQERRRHDELMDHPDCRDPEHPGCSRCREPERSCEDGCNGCDECTDYEEEPAMPISEFQPDDGPTTEEAAEFANVLPPTLEEAYAEGRADQTDEFAALLPGPYYMDPPDGGSVTVLEQFQRMAEDARKWREQQERANLAIDCEMRSEG